MLNLSQEPPASSKAPNKDSKDMNVLCTFKIKIEGQNSNHGCIKDQLPYPNQVQDAKPQWGTCSVLPSPKWGLKGHGCSLHLQNKNSNHGCIEDQLPYPNQDQNAKPKSGTFSVLCTFKIKIESQKSDHGCIKDQLPYPNHDEDSKPKSWTLRILQSPK